MNKYGLSFKKWGGGYYLETVLVGLKFFPSMIDKSECFYLMQYACMGFFIQPLSTDRKSPCCSLFSELL